MLKGRRCKKFQLTMGLSVCFSPLCYKYNRKTTIISMILVIETWNRCIGMVYRSIFASPFLESFFFLNLTGYELLALPHSLLPNSRHGTAISINRLQIWNQNANSLQHHLLPLPTSNLYRSLGVFIDIFCCTTNDGQIHMLWYCHYYYLTP